MEIFLYSRTQTGHSPHELVELVDLMNGSFPNYRVNRDFATLLNEVAGETIPPQRLYDTVSEGEQRESIAISYGGDGTFLDCVMLVAEAGIPVLGINSGRLGFLANVPKQGIGQALKDLLGGNYEIENRLLLQAEGDFRLKPVNPFAFNEFSLQRSGAGMIAVEVFVDGGMVATYWGDGVMLSTPSGSTAYSLSVGGPVLDPQCSCMVLSPIAPHNLSMRPVVIPDSKKITLKVRSRHDSPYATLDNRTFIVDDGAEFTLSKSKKMIKLIKLQNISFYDTLRNKMMWGLDRREECK